MERKEAIEKVRQMSLPKETMEILEALAPELRESEDERITRAINNMLPFIPDEAYANNGVTKEDVLRWLEKQKEQKPVEWKPQPESLEALMYAIEGKWDMISPTSYLSRRLEDLYDGLVNTYNVDEPPLAELPKTAYTAKDIEELRALKAKIEASMDEKPAEWSEEDEKRIKQLIYDTEAIRAGYEKKKEQLGDRFNDALIKDCDEQIRWLKSLRPQPHWKPNEEQIEALERTIRLANFGAEENRRRALESLHDQLKKLM